MVTVPPSQLAPRETCHVAQLDGRGEEVTSRWLNPFRRHSADVIPYFLAAKGEAAFQVTEKRSGVPRPSSVRGRPGWQSRWDRSLLSAAQLSMRRRVEALPSPHPEPPTVAPRGLHASLSAGGTWEPRTFCAEQTGAPSPRAHGSQLRSRRDEGNANGGLGCHGELSCRRSDMFFLLSQQFRGFALLGGTGNKCLRENLTFATVCDYAAPAAVQLWGSPRTQRGPVLQTGTPSSAKERDAALSRHPASQASF